MKKHLQSLKLTLLNIGSVSLDQNWNYDNVISPFSRMYYISEGEARVFHNDKTFELKPGRMYLIPSYTYSRYQCESFMHQYYISFMEELGDGLSIYNAYEFFYEIEASNNDVENFKRLLQLNPDRALVNDDPEVYDNRPSILRFIERNEALSTSAYLETHGTLISLVSKFIKSRKLTLLSSKKSTLSHKLIESAQYISKNLSQNLSVEELARRHHLNSDYFSRMFKRQMGIPPNKYIQNKRIEHAQLLLSTTTDSLQQIADKTGFPNVSYFSRLF